MQAEAFEITKQFVTEEEELVCSSLYLIEDAQDNSIIEAKKLFIDGQTSPYSSQFAHTANVNTHRGTLRCHQAEINTLDGGEVHATNVHIKNAQSGSVYAQDVTIDSVEENVKVIASHSITVHNVRSTNNTFLIDYKQVPIILSKLAFIDTDIKALNTELDDAKRHNHSLIPHINEKIVLLEKEKAAIINASKTQTITLNNSPQSS